MASPRVDSSRSARAQGLRQTDEMVHYFHSGSRGRCSTNRKWYSATYVSTVPIIQLPSLTACAAALTDISSAFHSTALVTNLSVSLYMLSMAIFPLFWSSFSEIYGRRTIYLSSFLVYFVFNVLSAESQNIAMFLVMRILSGGASASVQAVGAGTIADVWEIKERGQAMGYFYLGPLCGPLLAPIVGGALAESLGWRSTMWFQVIYGAVIWFLVLLFLPETLKVRKDVIAEAEREAVEAEKKSSEGTAARPTLSRTTTRQSVRVKTRKYAAMFRTCFIDPLAIILNFRLPAVALTVYYASITFGCLYVLNISVQQTFSQQPYNFSTIIVGLLYIPNSLGYFISSLLGGRWVDYIMHREARKAGRYDENGNLIFQPEDRMRENAWLGAFMYPIALFWYGWSAQEGVHWICPVSRLTSPATCNQESGTDLSTPDDCQFLLRRGHHARLRHRHDNAYRVHARPRLPWHRTQQFHPEHLCLCWFACR